MTRSDRIYWRACCFVAALIIVEAGHRWYLPLHDAAVRHYYRRHP